MQRYSYILLILFAAACNMPNKNSNSKRFTKDSTAVFNFIHSGDSLYSSKASYLTFSKSLDLYNSAWQVANQSNDTSLLAACVFAKGRAFDAINNNPQKTINYYTEAAQLYATLPNKQAAALYIKHLVAHSYDKVKDSTHCINILNELFTEIENKPDSVRKQMGFIAEMALVSTEVNNYTLADSILQHLTKRQWIINDNTEYDYLNHYYLTQAKIAVFMKQHIGTPYLDSVETVLKYCSNLSDSMFYSSELYQLNKWAKNSSKENYYLQLNNAVFNKFNSPEKVRETQDKIAKMEVAAIETQRKVEQELSALRKLFIYILTTLLAVITLLALFLAKRNKEIKRKKKELEKKNLQNELLNKEIHHRVKNNLQMIMSLVYMQERNSDTEEVKKNMQNIRLRIESIAELHQQLIEQADEVDLKKYIQKIVSNVSNLLGDDKNVLTYLEIQPLKVSQKISFPLGLIINEWITNSVKYAQPVAAPLTLFIEIWNVNDEIKIYYKDNGKPQITKANKKSLGLSIINLLVAQLNGTIKTDAENIFNYHVTIPLTSGD